MRGISGLHSADLTENALRLTQQRLDCYGLEASLTLQNAESMTFPDAYFAHVNCQGVIHHTPDTEATIAEIARVMRPGGTASISVYYRNFFLRLWPYIRWVGVLLAGLGGGLKGEAEKIFFSSQILMRSCGSMTGWKIRLARAIREDSFLKCYLSTFMLTKHSCTSSRRARYHLDCQNDYTSGLIKGSGL